MSDLLVLGRRDVEMLLTDADAMVMQVVANTYRHHSLGLTTVPHSHFLHLPGDPGTRIIALPAHLHDPVGIAGIKWISCVPANIRHGIERASALIVLNELERGRAFAVIEGATISSKRTAASAALAVEACHGRPIKRVALVGCGPINFEVLRFLARLAPSLQVSLYDLATERAAALMRRMERELEDVDAQVTRTLSEATRESDVVSFGTTASRPYVFERGLFKAGTTILNISLRDLSPEIVLASDNVADDIEHVCRAQTSLDLAKTLTGHAGFVRATIGDVLLGKAPGRSSIDDVLIFSPFGLGILDVAVGHWLFRSAVQQGLGTRVEWLPASGA